ncbi:uncharacterized protein LOC129304706 [Prosopis cineraria]|uniref:uncharacterized protein LOC129304706 n=1 Tax=Prosopis cineraria TaxID=364024 RepID=UPI002410AAF6|nr:uncharacterized protein LOC129304706 [Prosopis cineraria]XP_054800446.1 uncharacterized protein LOC129304706 [Prosopis cineraria]XP_054800454.1 uncharacterized protein LOC129304706 [Prosopis cineraria]
MPPAGCVTASKLREKDIKLYSEGNKLSRSPCCEEHGDYMNQVSSSKRPKWANHSVMHPSAKAQIECQLRSFPVTLSIHAPSTMASHDGIAKELLQISSSTLSTVFSNAMDRSPNDIEAEDAEPSVRSPSTSTRLGKETQRELKALKDLLSKIFLYCCIWEAAAP